MNQKFRIKIQQVFYYRGDGNGYANSMFWLRTGIGVAKHVHPDDTYYNSDAAKVKDKDEPAIRYADILLMYAEALNELTTSYEVPSWDGSITLHNQPQRRRYAYRYKTNTHACRGPRL